MGNIDCLTVRAEAPVRPLLDTLFRCCCLMASVFDGRRWLETSEVSGSSLEKNMIAADGKGKEKIWWCDRRDFGLTPNPFDDGSLARYTIRKTALMIGNGARWKREYL